MDIKKRIIVYSSVFIFCVVGTILLLTIDGGINKKVKESVPMTFYIQSTGYQHEETFTKYFVSYTINKSKQKPILAVFISEQEKFEFLIHLESQGDIIWLSDKQ